MVSAVIMPLSLLIFVTCVFSLFLLVTLARSLSTILTFFLKNQPLVLLISVFLFQILLIYSLIFIFLFSPLGLNCSFFSSFLKDEALRHLSWVC